jgi:hypothetical protein
MKRILLLILSISFLQFFTNDAFAGNSTYPTAISGSSSGGTICLGQAVTLSSAITTTTQSCSGGTTGNPTVTVTWFSNGTTNSNTGGTQIGTGASATGLSSVNCGETVYFYAVASWNAAGCAPAGSVTSAPVAVTNNNCTCLAPGVDVLYTGCGTTFYDTGGASGNYLNNQDYVVVFCPSTPDEVIRIDFSSFNTQGTGGACTDCIEVYEGVLGGFLDVFGGTDLPVPIISTSADGCVTLRFRSDATTVAAGWVAAVSCVTPCRLPTGALNMPSEIVVCPSTATNAGNATINFDGSTSTLGAYSGGGFSLSQYIWDFGDGTSSTTGSSSTTRTYQPGVYNATLIVADNNTGGAAGGCRSTNAANVTIKVLQDPIITATGTGVCNGCADLQVVATPQTTSTERATDAGGFFSLPDGTGVSYDEGINLAGAFQEGATVTAGCYPVLCLDLEHSFSRDLRIELCAPNGTCVILFDRHIISSGSGASASVSMFGACVNQSTAPTGSPVIPGCPATYCIQHGTGRSWTSYTVTDEYGCIYSGTIGVTVTCPLSNNAITFVANNEGNKNLLKWTMADIEGVENFFIERMNDSENDWKTVSRVSAKGNQTSFIYQDQTYSKGNNYYRIKMTHADGPDSYSDMVVINNSAVVKNVIRVYNAYGQEVPRDTKGMVILLFEDGTTEKVYQ